MKRIFFIVGFSIFTLMAVFSQSNFVVRGINYTVISDTSIEVIRDEYSGDINIPAQIDYLGTVYKVTSIGKSAFEDCVNVKSVILPNTLKTIGFKAFNGCVGLKAIVIPKLVNAIDDYAFSDCTELIWLKVSSKVPPSLGVSVFKNVNKSIPVYVVNKSLTLYKSDDGWKEFLNSIGDEFELDWLTYRIVSVDTVQLIKCDTSLTDNVDIPYEVVYNNTNFKVASIGQLAFNNCNNISSISMLNSIGYIDNWAFYGLQNLTSIKLSDSIKSLLWGVLRNCSKLNSITIPGAVSYIDKNALMDCVSLTSIEFQPPSSLKFIGLGSFIHCTSLTSIVFPPSLEVIGMDAFLNCTGLKSISFPRSLTTIHPNAFSGCVGLASVTFPDSLITIQNFAFSGCVGLTSIISKSKTPPYLGSSVFFGVDKSIPVYVPEESVDLYQSTYGWNEFSSILGLITSNKQLPQYKYFYNSVTKSIQFLKVYGMSITLIDTFGQIIFSKKNSSDNEIIAVEKPGVYIISINGFKKKVLVY